jgi:hypothetical protein
VGMGFVGLCHVWNRIYADFFLPSRLEVFRNFLLYAIQHEYEICSVEIFWEKIIKKEIEQQKKYLVLRHDIDTDPATAKAMWQIENALGIKSSYYFRLSTIDVPLMCEIQSSGGEASYHFEEIATIAKEMHLKNKKQVINNMVYICRKFKNNLQFLRKITGLNMRVVASHGDFINRKLEIQNFEILKDETFRKEVNIELEVYDEKFICHSTSRHTDSPYPKFWQAKCPIEAIREGSRAMYVLVHPRQWYANIKVNSIDNVKRVIEGIRYSF